MFKKIDKKRLASSTMWSGVAMLAMAAAAQPAAAQDSEEVVVTGSRLVRSDLSAPSPIAVIGQELVEMSGDTTLESVLYELPQLSAGNTSSVNSGGGSGVLTANLRGLGAGRTLVLVNGRRFIPANGAGSVDLSVIPSALVERVEVITGGASAVYGSDAIAGAVNFILRDDIDGFEASYQYGQTSEGDGASHNYDAVFGANLADGRGNVTIYASHSQREPVFMEDREFSRIPLNANLGPSGSGNIPGGRVTLSAGQTNTLNVGGGPGVLPTEGTCSTRVNGFRFGANGQVFAHCDPETLYNYAAGNYLLRPLERWQASALAHYEITPNVEAYIETHYANARNAFQQASDSLGIVTGTNSYFEVVNYATNPVLTPDVRSLFVNNTAIFDPTLSGNARIPGGLNRRIDELGLRNFSFERQTFGGTLGLRGDLDIGDDTWVWDIFAQHHRSRTDEEVTGTMSPARMSLGLNTAVVSGQVVCATQVLGCVPVNPFGLNSISPAAAAFISPARSSSDEFVRSVAGASIAGDLFTLPAGPVSIALGTEYREDEYVFMPGATDLNREYGSASRGITRGGFDVTEYFGEVRVPLLADLPLVHILAIEGALRHSSYSNFGGADTWRVGGEWAPVEWLRFRTAYNVASRAPSISELFAPVGTGFNSGTDPCAAARNPSQATRDFCVTQGVPVAERDNFVQAALGFSQVSGGNPNLTEETSETITAGFVLNAPFLDGFNLAIDYYKIEVDNAVATMNAQTTINVCYVLMDASSAPCQAVTRLPGSGQVFEVRASNSNIGSLVVEGFDLSADYTFALPDALGIGDDGADIGLVYHAGWLSERTSQIIGAPPIDCAGYFGSCTAQGSGGSPDFKSTFMATYSSGPIMLRTQVRYFGDLERRPDVPSTTPITADAITYVDFSGAFDITEHVQLFGGVDNALDEQPPLLTSAYGGDANTDATLYDIIGRRYFMGVRARF